MQLQAAREGDRPAAAHTCRSALSFESVGAAFSTLRGPSLTALRLGQEWLSRGRSSGDLSSEGSALENILQGAVAQPCRTAHSRFLRRLLLHKQSSSLSLNSTTDSPLSATAATKRLTIIAEAGASGSLLYERAFSTRQGSPVMVQAPPTLPGQLLGALGGVGDWLLARWLELQASWPDTCAVLASMLCLLQAVLLLWVTGSDAASTWAMWQWQHHSAAAVSICVIASQQLAVGCLIAQSQSIHFALAPALVLPCDIAAVALLVAVGSSSICMFLRRMAWLRPTGKMRRSCCAIAGSHSASSGSSSLTSWIMSLSGWSSKQSQEAFQSLRLFLYNYLAMRRPLQGLCESLIMFAIQLATYTLQQRGTSLSRQRLLLQAVAVSALSFTASAAQLLLAAHAAALPLCSYCSLLLALRGTSELPLHWHKQLLRSQPASAPPPTTTTMTSKSSSNATNGGMAAGSTNTKQSSSLLDNAGLRRPPLLIAFTGPEFCVQLQRPQQMALLYQALSRGRTIITDGSAAVMPATSPQGGGKGPVVLTHRSGTGVALLQIQTKEGVKIASRLLPHALKASKLANLSISQSHLFAPEVTALTGRLHSPSCMLTRLVLREVDVSLFCFSQLAKALAHNTSVRQLDMSNNKLGLVGAKDVRAMLRHNSHIQQLVLAYCHLTSPAAEEILAGVYEHPCLVSLDLSQNRIGDQAPCFQGLASQNKTLHTLDLSFNRARDGLALWLVTVLEAFPYLQHLSLNHNVPVVVLPRSLTPCASVRMRAGTTLRGAAAALAAAAAAASAPAVHAAAVAASFARQASSSSMASPAPSMNGRDSSWQAYMTHSQQQRQQQYADCTSHGNSGVGDASANASDISYRGGGPLQAISSTESRRALTVSGNVTAGGGGGGNGVAVDPMAASPACLQKAAQEAGQELAAHLVMYSPLLLSRIASLKRLDLRGIAFPSWFERHHPPSLLLDMRLVFSDMLPLPTTSEALPLTPLAAMPWDSGTVVASSSVLPPATASKRSLSSFGSRRVVQACQPLRVPVAANLGPLSVVSPRHALTQPGTPLTPASAAVSAAILDTSDNASSSSSSGTGAAAPPLHVGLERLAALPCTVLPAKAALAGPTGNLAPAATTATTAGQLPPGLPPGLDAAALAEALLPAALSQRLLEEGAQLGVQQPDFLSLGRAQKVAAIYHLLRSHDEVIITNMPAEENGGGLLSTTGFGAADTLPNGDGVGSIWGLNLTGWRTPRHDSEASPRSSLQSCELRPDVFAAACAVPFVRGMNRSASMRNRNRRVSHSLLPSPHLPLRQQLSQNLPYVPPMSTSPKGPPRGYRSASHALGFVRPVSTLVSRQPSHSQALPMAVAAGGDSAVGAPLMGSAAPLVAPLIQHIVPPRRGRPGRPISSGDGRAGPVAHAAALLGPPSPQGPGMRRQLNHVASSPLGRQSDAGLTSALDLASLRSSTACTNDMLSTTSVHPPESGQDPEQTPNAPLLLRCCSAGPISLAASRIPHIDSRAGRRRHNSISLGHSGGSKGAQAEQAQELGMEGAAAADCKGQQGPDCCSTGVASLRAMRIDVSLACNQSTGSVGTPGSSPGQAGQHSASQSPERCCVEYQMRCPGAIDKPTSGGTYLEHPNDLDVNCHSTGLSSRALDVQVKHPPELSFSHHISTGLKPMALESHFRHACELVSCRCRTGLSPRALVRQLEHHDESELSHLSCDRGPGTALYVIGQHSERLPSHPPTTIRTLTRQHTTGYNSTSLPQDTHACSSHHSGTGLPCSSQVGPAPPGQPAWMLHWQGPNPCSSDCGLDVEHGQLHCSHNRSSTTMAASCRGGAATDVYSSVPGSSIADGNATSCAMPGLAVVLDSAPGGTLGALPRLGMPPRLGTAGYLCPPPHSSVSTSYAGLDFDSDGGLSTAGTAVDMLSPRCRDVDDLLHARTAALLKQPVAGVATLVIGVAPSTAELLATATAYANGSQQARLAATMASCDGAAVPPASVSQALLLPRIPLDMLQLPMRAASTTSGTVFRIQLAYMDAAQCSQLQALLASAAPLHIVRIALVCCASSGVANTAIAAGVAGWGMHELVIVGVLLGNGFITALCPALASPLCQDVLHPSHLQLRSLVLRDTAIGPAGAVELVAALMEHSTVTELDLSHNSLEVEGVLAVAQLLSSQIAYTAKHSNSGSSVSGSGGPGVSGDFLSTGNDTAGGADGDGSGSVALRTLDLSAVGAGSGGAKAILLAVRGHPCLQELSLVANQVGRGVLPALRELLATNTVLQSIDLDGNLQLLQGTATGEGGRPAVAPTTCVITAWNEDDNWIFTDKCLSRLQLPTSITASCQQRLEQAVGTLE